MNYYNYLQDEEVARLIDVTYTIKKDDNNEKIRRNLCSLRQKEKTNIEPLVNLDKAGYLISQVVLNFVSQTNIMTRETWERLGQP